MQLWDSGDDTSATSSERRNRFCLRMLLTFDKIWNALFNRTIRGYRANANSQEHEQRTVADRLKAAPTSSHEGRREHIDDGEQFVESRVMHIVYTYVRPIILVVLTSGLLSRVCSESDDTAATTGLAATVHAAVLSYPPDRLIKPPLTHTRVVNAAVRLAPLLAASWDYALAYTPRCIVHTYVIYIYTLRSGNAFTRWRAACTVRAARRKIPACWVTRTFPLCSTWSKRRALRNRRWSTWKNSSCWFSSDARFFFSALN